MIPIAVDAETSSPIVFDQRAAVVKQEVGMSDKYPRGSLAASLDIFERSRQATDVMPTDLVNDLEVIRADALGRPDEIFTEDSRLSLRAEGLSETSVYLAPTAGGRVCYVAESSRAEYRAIECVDALSDAWSFTGYTPMANGPTWLFGILTNEIVAVEIRGGQAPYLAVVRDNAFFAEIRTEDWQSGSGLAAYLTDRSGNSARVSLGPEDVASFELVVE